MEQGGGSGEPLGGLPAGRLASSRYRPNVFVKAVSLKGSA
jgi:hypothetical protein